MDSQRSAVSRLVRKCEHDRAALGPGIPEPFRRFRRSRQRFDGREFRAVGGVPADERRARGISRVHECPIPVALSRGGRSESARARLRAKQEHGGRARVGRDRGRSHLCRARHEVAEEMDCAFDRRGIGRPRSRNVRRDQGVSNQRPGAQRPGCPGAVGADESRRSRRVTHDAMASCHRWIQGPSASRLRIGEPQSRLERALRSRDLQARHGHIRSHPQSIPGDARHHRPDRHRCVSRHLDRDRVDTRQGVPRRQTLGAGSRGPGGTPGRVRDVSVLLVRRSQLDDALDSDRRVDRIAGHGWLGGSGSERPGRRGNNDSTDTRSGIDRSSSRGGLWRRLHAASRESRSRRD